ncbi:hypothetical protein M5689_020833 [Euphorbia peplus]|nr:hypothetical protein M5689_020833 [Euphorbia peplus]
MKILAWNVWGMGNPRSVRSLTRVVRKNCPSLVFISETRLQKKEVDNLRWRFTNFNFFSVDAVGQLGGLMLMWCKEIDLAILGSCDHCIHFEILSSDGVMLWRGIVIYGWPQKGNKFKTWEMMRDLHQRENVLWVCFGDFNEVMYSLEKKGGTELSGNAQHLFRMCLLNCDLFDIGFKGSAYTWSNGRKGHEAVSERLDRFVCSVDWDIIFQNSVVFHLDKGTSDHTPLLLDTDGVRKDRFKPFRLEAMWVKEMSCKDIVDST